MSNRLSVFTQSYISNLMQPPCLLLKITPSPQNVNTAESLHIVFTKIPLSAEKRRQSLRRLRLLQNRSRVGGSTLPLTRRELEPMAHASTKQHGKCQTASRFFTSSSSGLHIRALDTVPRRRYIGNRIEIGHNAQRKT